MTRISFLDGWRGLAVLSVLFAHFGTAQFINLGRFGVELFFVLSGRLMAEILFVRDARLRDFFPRRFSRVYPALIVFATLVFAAGVVRGGDMTWAKYVAAITFTANYAQFWIGRAGDLDHIWSLCIEEHMYILLGVVAFFHRRRSLPLVRLFIGMITFSVLVGLVQTFQGLTYNQVYWRTDVRGASILMGATAYLVMHAGKLRFTEGSKIPSAIFAIGVLLNADFFPDPVKYSIGTASVAISLATLPMASDAIRRALSNAAFLRAGLWSYSLYLWQQPFYKLGGGILDRAIHVAITLILAVISFYCVEQPARKWINGMLERRKSVVVS